MKKYSIEEKAKMFDWIVDGLKFGLKYRLDKNCDYDSNYECGRQTELDATAEMDKILREFEDIMPMDKAIQVLDLLFEDIEPDVYDPWWENNPLRKALKND
jgi:hypothetical protein